MTQLIRSCRIDREKKKKLENNTGNQYSAHDMKI